jgi:hypothetical protein
MHIQQKMPFDKPNILSVSFADTKNISRINMKQEEKYYRKKQETYEEKEANVLFNSREKYSAHKK